ncbi:hypothetical protein HK101_007705 [Irineochytrium annulatum]|nr:hypothetical protein HK101_007705 [Irineochytrium annulatum]
MDPRQHGSRPAMKKSLGEGLNGKKRASSRVSIVQFSTSRGSLTRNKGHPRPHPPAPVAHKGPAPINVDEDNFNELFSEAASDDDNNEDFEDEEIYVHEEASVRHPSAQPNPAGLTVPFGGHGPQGQRGPGNRISVSKGGNKKNRVSFFSPNARSGSPKPHAGGTGKARPQSEVSEVVVVEEDEGWDDEDDEEEMFRPGKNASPIARSEVLLRNLLGKPMDGGRRQIGRMKLSRNLASVALRKACFVQVRGPRPPYPAEQVGRSNTATRAPPPMAQPYNGPPARSLSRNQKPGPPPPQNDLPPVPQLAQRSPQMGPPSPASSAASGKLDNLMQMFDDASDDDSVLQERPSIPLPNQRQSPDLPHNGRMPPGASRPMAPGDDQRRRDIPHGTVSPSGSPSPSAPMQPLRSRNNSSSSSQSGSLSAAGSRQEDPRQRQPQRDSYDNLVDDDEDSASARNKQPIQITVDGPEGLDNNEGGEDDYDYLDNYRNSRASSMLPSELGLDDRPDAGASFESDDDIERNSYRDTIRDTIRDTVMMDLVDTVPTTPVTSEAPQIPIKVIANLGPKLDGGLLELPGLQQALQAAESQLPGLQSELEETRGALNRTERHLEASRELETRLQSQIGKLTAEIGLVAKERDDAIAEQEALEDRVEELTRELAAAREGTGKLQSEVQALRDRLGDLELARMDITDERDALAAKVGQLEESLKRAAEEVAERLKERDEAEEETEAVIEERDALKGEIEDWVGRVRDMEERLAFAEDALEEAEESARRTTGDVDGEVGRLRGELREAKADVDERGRELDQAKETISVLAGRVAQLESELETLGREADGQDSKVAELKNMLKEVGDRHREAERTVEDMRRAHTEEIAKSVMRGDSLHRNLEEAVSERERWESKVVHLEEALRGLEDQRNAWRERAEQLSRTLEQTERDAGDRVAALERALDDAAGDTGLKLEELQLEAVEARNRLQAADSRIQALEDERAGFEAETSARSKELETALAGAADEREDLEDRVSSLHRDLEEAEEQRERTGARLQQLETALRGMTEERDDLRANLTELERALEDANADREELEDRVASLERSLRNAEASAAEASRAAEEQFQRIREEVGMRAIASGHEDAIKIEQVRSESRELVRQAQEELELARTEEAQLKERVAIAERAAEDASLAREGVLWEMERMKKDVEALEEEVRTTKGELETIQIQYEDAMDTQTRQVLSCAGCSVVLIGLQEAANLRLEDEVKNLKSRAINADGEVSMGGQCANFVLAYPSQLFTVSADAHGEAKSRANALGDHALKSRMADLESEINQKETQMAEIRQALRQKVDECDALDTRLSEAEDLIREMGDHLADANRDIANLRADVAESQAKAAELETSKKALEEAVDGAETRARHESELAQLEIEKLNSRIKEMEGLLASRSVDGSDASDNAVATLPDIDEIVQARVQEKLAEAAASEESLREKIEQLEEQSQVGTAALVQQLQEQQEEAKEMREALVARLRGQESEASEMRTQIEQLKAETEAAVKKAQEAEGLKAKSEEQARDMAEANEERARTIDAAFHSAQQEIETLRSQLEPLKSQLEASRAEAWAFVQQHRAMGGSLDGMPPAAGSEVMMGMSAMANVQIPPVVSRPMSQVSQSSNNSVSTPTSSGFFGLPFGGGGQATTPIPSMPPPPPGSVPATGTGGFFGLPFSSGTGGPPRPPSTPPTEMQQPPNAGVVGSPLPPGSSPKAGTFLSSVSSLWGRSANPKVPPPPPSGAMPPPPPNVYGSLPPPPPQQEAVDEAVSSNETSALALASDPADLGTDTVKVESSKGDDGDGVGIIAESTGVPTSVEGHVEGQQPAEQVEREVSLEDMLNGPPPISKDGDAVADGGEAAKKGFLGGLFGR